jgi:hypothetical protein
MATGLPHDLAFRAVTAHEQTPPVRASRLARVDDAVCAAGDGVASGGSPRHAVFDELRGRLRRVHDACEQVDDRAWADYVTRLDRGLDELAVEVGRAGEPSAAGSAADAALYVHATRLEVDGWVLRLDHARDGWSTGRDGVRELAARAGRYLDEYRRGAATRADVDRTLDDIRAVSGT